MPSYYIGDSLDAKLQSYVRCIIMQRGVFVSSTIVKAAAISGILLTYDKAIWCSEHNIIPIGKK